MTADFEIGHYIRESVIPRAVLYFTGISLFLHIKFGLAHDCILGEALMEDEFSEEDEEGDLEEGVC